MDKGVQVGGFTPEILPFLWEYTCISQMQAIISGRLQREAAAKTGFLTNMITATATTVVKSGIRVVTKLFSTSFRELMSPMILARIFPVGRLSKIEDPVSGYGYKAPGGWSLKYCCRPWP